MVLQISETGLRQYTIGVSPSTKLFDDMSKGELSVEETMLRLDFYSDFVPERHTLRSNDRYITYLAKDLDSEAFVVEDGRLAKDMTMMVYDNQYKPRVGEVLPKERIESGSNLFIDLFQAIPSAVTKMTSNLQNLGGYLLLNNYLFTINDGGNSLAEAYKIMPDFSFIVNNNDMAEDPANILLKINDGFGLAEESIGDLWEINSGGGWVKWLIFGCIGGVVLIGLMVWGIWAFCKKKQNKTSWQQPLYVDGDDA